MKKLFFLVWLTSQLGDVIFSANIVTLGIDARDTGAVIPKNFIGISVSSASIDGDHRYKRCFTAANTQMVNLFREIGVKHLRTIMGKAEEGQRDPTDPEIDAFFDFAQAAGVEKVIWSLHLMNTEGKTNEWSNNRAVAEHIWKTTTAKGTVERDLLESFAFDNEPDWLRYIHHGDPVITGYGTPAGRGYIDRWRYWHGVISEAAPGANFSGPDTGSKWPAGQATSEINTSIAGVPFTLRFGTDAGADISLATQHFYGQHAGSNTVLQMAKACLSSEWLATNYSLLYSNALAGATSPRWPKGRAGAPMPFRFTECSAFDNSKNRGNQCFATALWALDFYHWWAERGCVGVDPFTRTVQYNAPIFDDGKEYVAEACAYGMKAFNLGSGGKVIEHLAIENPGQVNVTAYGVVNARHLFVTVINKTFDEVGAKAAVLAIPAPKGFTVTRAKYLVLSGGWTPGGAGQATIEGACLGGAGIPNDGAHWQGTWTTLPVVNGGISLTVWPTTAAIIDLEN